MCATRFKGRLYSGWVRLLMKQRACIGLVLRDCDCDCPLAFPWSQGSQVWTLDCIHTRPALLWEITKTLSTLQSPLNIMDTLEENHCQPNMLLKIIAPGKGPLIRFPFLFCTYNWETWKGWGSLASTQATNAQKLQRAMLPSAEVCRGFEACKLWFNIT